MHGKNKKIKLSKYIPPLLGSLALVLLAAGIAYLVFQPSKKPTNTSSNITQSALCQGLEIGNSCYGLERAETNQARIRGLSGRDNLPLNSGMLFVFENPDEQCFWMKDTRFSLDIIWTNEAKQIVKIEENVLPESYPANFCAKNTKYVLEFSAGFAKRHGLKTGTELKF